MADSSNKKKNNTSLNELVKESNKKIETDTKKKKSNKKNNNEKITTKKDTTGNEKVDNIDKNESVTKEEKIIEEHLEDKTEEIVIDEENKKEVIEEKNKEEISNTKNKFPIKILILILSVLFIGLISYLGFPKIILDGEDKIVINYNEEYIEPGYKGYFIFKDISKNIITNNNIDNSKIGEYIVNYHLKYGKINISKSRKVMVIDKIPPVIEYDSDEIKVCPNKEIDKLDYKATDEYDGDITDKVITNILDDKVILSVSDNSNNTNNKEIKINRIDDEKPVINLSGYTNTYINYGNKYYEAGYKANDNCDGDITDKVIVNGTVGSNIGTYKITYSVTDSSGNTSEVVRNVIVRNNYLYNSGSIGNGTIYLTFDDGPNNGTTNVILDILKEQGVKATFFVTCNGPDYLIKRMYDEGHTVALHTATHNYSYVYSSVDNYFEDLNRVKTRVKNITGMDAKIIRFPGGSSNTISRNYQVGIMSTLTGMVLDKGYRYFDWNVDSMDASTSRNSSDVYNNVVRNLSKSRSNVVLMHDIKAMTRDALRDIINYGYSNGYTFNRLENDTYMIRHSVNN